MDWDKTELCSVGLSTLHSGLRTGYSSELFVPKKVGVEYVNTCMQELFIMYYNTGSNNTKGWVEPQPSGKSHPGLQVDLTMKLENQSPAEFCNPPPDSLLGVYL